MSRINCPNCKERVGILEKVLFVSGVNIKCDNCKKVFIMSKKDNLIASIPFLLSILLTEVFNQKVLVLILGITLTLLITYLWAPLIEVDSDKVDFDLNDFLKELKDN